MRWQSRRQLTKHFTTSVLEFVLINIIDTRGLSHYKTLGVIELARSASFEYLFYVTTTILNIWFFQRGDRLLRQILKSKVDPRAERVIVL